MAVDLNVLASIVKGRYPAFSYLHPQTFQVTATVPANQGAGVQTVSSILINGVPYSSFTVPSSQVYEIYDLFTTSTTATATDANVYFMKNGVKTMFESAPLSSELVSNNTRPLLPSALEFEPETQLSLNVAPVATAGTTTTTDTFFISAYIFDKTFSL